MKNTGIIKYTVTIEEIVQDDTAFFRAVATDPIGNFADIKVLHYLINGVDYDRDIQLAAVMNWAKMMEQGRRFIKKVYETGQSSDQPSLADFVVGGRGYCR